MNKQDKAFVDLIKKGIQRTVYECARSCFDSDKAYDKWAKEANKGRPLTKWPKSKIMNRSAK